MKQSAKLMLVGAMAVTSAAQAAVLETSLFYSQELETDTTYATLSQQVVGWYYNIDHANDVFANSGVNLQLKPTAINDVNFLTAANSHNEARIEMLTQIKDGIPQETGHIAMALGQATGSIAGASGMFDSSYFTGDRVRFVGLSYDVAMNTTSPYLALALAHEVGHTLGADHSANNARIEPYAYPADLVTPCDNGLPSLMYPIIVDGGDELVSISGAADCAADGTADNVTLLNTYAPMAQAQHAAKNNQTLTLAVEENINGQQFTFQVTRTDTAFAGTATVYVAGEGTGIAPMTVNFAAGESVSEEVALPFTQVHGLFDEQQAFSVYAVAVSDSEMGAQLIDLSAVNTQWTQDSVENDENDGEEHVAPDNSSDDSGGGSIGWVSLLLLVLMWRRR
ncbi:M12 family metallo-peptidase [Grimontia hollisae]|uniref:M12 family metallo-peptidase n=1 Tax=Grimontia hollisae TaxID=673 RepID=UPI0023DB0F24|nr:M12 family metallo-peptidase [Grimontia hollisae]MDF2186126.1 M12 family metallo-peptidase [Grimontia hollisae]